MGTKIEWCDETINPLGWGCYGPEGTPENPKRCPYCYAYRMAKRNLRDCPQCREFIPHLHPEQLKLLEKWEKPRRIFLQSMGDMFHPAIETKYIDTIMNNVAHYSHHTYLTLTKCAEHMCHYFRGLGWNFDNLHVGITAEDQDTLNKRIVWLLRIREVAVRWVSLEPLMGLVDLTEVVDEDGDSLDVLNWYGRGIGGYHGPITGLNWVVVGAQTGPGAIKPKREWVQSIVDQCRAAGVPVFLKDNLKDIWPGELIREFPEVRA